MLTLEDMHGRWHSGKSLLLVVGQRAKLDAAVVPVLNWIFSGNYYGTNLNWADATLQITTRALEANVARIAVVSHLERPSFGRTASYDLTGELELELPSGWPKRFVIDGRWARPVPVLAGNTTIRGEFRDESTWSYDGEPPVSAGPAQPPALTPSPSR